MKCNDMPEKLAALLYNELEPKEAGRVQKHLEGCQSCMQAYQKLQSTTQLLGKWEDATPNMNFVFVKDTHSRLQTWIQKMRHFRWPVRIAWSVPAVALLFLVALSVTNFHASSQNGNWEVSFSLTPQRNTTQPVAVNQATLQAMREEMAVMVSGLIEESESRQRVQSQRALARFAQDIESQRRQDLRMVGLGLEGLQRSTQGQLNQTSGMIQDLIRMTSYQSDQ